MTTCVSLFARILMIDSNVWLMAYSEWLEFLLYAISYSLFALLQRHVYDVGEWGVTVVHVDIKTLLTEGPHRIEPLFFPWPPATDPNLHAVQLALRLGFAKAGNDSAERFLHIREVGDRTTHDDVLDTRQRADLVGEHFHSPIGRVT